MDNTDNKAFDPTRFFTVLPYPPRASAPWKMEIRASFAGRKVRRFCQSEAEAWETGRRLVHEIREKGTEAATARENGGLSVARAVSMFLPRVADKSKSHREKSEAILGKLGKRFKSLHGVGATELEEWITAWSDSPTSQATTFRYCRMFFRWAYRRQLVGRNPMDALDCPRSKPRRNILTPEEMQAAMKAADGWMLAALLLGGFAGLRTAEILRMNWGDIDTKAGEIHVRPGVMKDSGGFDQRIVNFTEPLSRRGKMLKKLAVKFHRGKLIPVSDRIFHRERAALVGGIGWEKWPENVLRHSFATYHLGKSGNPGMTAFQMGHTSPAMVQRVYSVPARRADWKAWWAI